MNFKKLKTIKAVVFDMDGLMFDSERYVQRSWDIAGERLGYGPLGHNIVNTLGTNLTNRKKYFLEHYGNDFPFERFLDTYRDAYYELVQDGVPAKKGLHEIIEVLRDKKLKIGVATSSSREHAINGIRSAHAARMNPVMVPDIVQDTSKIDALLFGKCESLLEFAEILKGIRLDIEDK